MADNTENIVETWRRDWSELPSELLEEILLRLYLEDLRSFHGVCRCWRRIQCPREHDPLQFPTPESQWLLHKECSKTTYQFLHPVYPSIRYARNLLEDVNNAVPRHSKDGWILMSSGRYSLLFFSPFSKTVIKLPDLPREYYGYERDGITFSCAPTHPDCVIFGISGFYMHVRISTICKGRRRWREKDYGNNVPFVPSSTNPVFHKGMFYCLGSKGNLGVYNHEETTWKVLDNLKRPRKKSNESYLVDYEGKLMSIFMGYFGSWVSIYKFNEPNMVWEDVYELGEYALFLSIPTSFARNHVLGIMKNKIFLPLLHQNYPVFYSLDTQKFCTYGSSLNCNDFYRVEVADQLECCWLEPKEIYCAQEELEWYDPNVEDETYYESEAYLETDDDESEEETDDDESEEETDDDESKEETDNELKEETDDDETNKEPEEAEETDSERGNERDYETSHESKHKIDDELEPETHMMQ